MLWKCVKVSAIGLVAVALVGGLVFGKDLMSYLHSSTKSLRTAVKDSVPLDFELQRAKDLLEGIIPEMQANVRVIATEEVEVASLDSDVQHGQLALAQERKGLEQLAGAMGIQQAAYSFGGREYTRQQVKDDLARRFDRFKEAESVLESKRRLLDSRKSSLQAAMKLLETTRSQKALLEDKIATLEGQYRLVQAAASSSRFQVDNTKLAQTEKLIGEIKKRLDVAERVLAHEATFVPQVEVDTVSEKDLLTQIEQHFGAAGEKADQGEKGLAAGEAPKALSSPDEGGRLALPH
jgi:chromosome segregation ATPase